MAAPTIKRNAAAKGTRRKAIRMDEVLLSKSQGRVTDPPSVAILSALGRGVEIAARGRQIERAISGKSRT